MKFKEYLQLIADPDGFIPLPRFRWEIRQNERSTAREEAIVAEVIKQANPRENITGSFSWAPEQTMVLQQLWIHPFSDSEVAVWRDVPTKGAKGLYSDVPTEFGDLPVPNAVKEPGQVRGDFQQRLKEILGGE